jgi:uncharacterized damage-inducible protein DinB
MTPEHYLVLAQYNQWMNEKVYAAASKLSDAERTLDRGAFFKSIHGTLNHILLGDRVWLARFKAEKLENGWIGPGGIRTLDQELYADFAELQRERVKTDAEIERWVGALTAEGLNANLQYVRSGASIECPLWWAVAHLFNHQTHHRGQVTTLLMQAGRDPGVTDLFAMLRSR